MSALLQSPTVLLLAGGVLAAAAPAWLRRILLVALPLAVLALLWSRVQGDAGAPAALPPDRLSAGFAAVMLLGTALIGIYGWRIDDRLQQSALLLYAGGALTAVLAPDRLALLVGWDLAALASTILVWARRTPQAYRAGFRYLALQLGGAALVLAGTALRHDAGAAIGPVAARDAGALLLLLGFGVAAAFPLLHVWLREALTESTRTGMLALSLLTPALGVYALMRSFPGAEVLLWIGAAMALLPLPYAALAQDLRRALGYLLMSQLGAVIVGIGLGGAALDTAAACAWTLFGHQLLLLMAAGAIGLPTGRTAASAGAFAGMRQTAALALVGAASLVALPPLAGFIGRPLLAELAAARQPLLALALGLAQAGTVLVVALRLRDFAPRRGPAAGDAAEAPVTMRLAMALAAALVVLPGAWPQGWTPLLPNATPIAPYAAGALLRHLAVLALAIGVAYALVRLGLRPRPRALDGVDADALYRAAGRIAGRLGDRLGGLARGAVAGRFATQWRRLAALALMPVQPAGRVAAPWSTSAAAAWITLLLLAFLVIALR